MVEKIGHIKNPLTVIAIFAAISEISGTSVLPFIAADNQSIYIWFLMLFPVLLVAIFFITLNFNHKVLYAPSDYKDEKNFLLLFDKATPEEQEEKFKQEITEAKYDIEQEQSKQSNAIKSVDLAAVNREVVARFSLAEKLAINKLAKQLNLPIRPDVKFNVGRRGIIFDGVAFDGNKVHGIEVKMFRNESLLHPRHQFIFAAAEEISHQLQAEKRVFILHFVAVIDGPNVDVSKLETNLVKFSEKYRIEVKFHILRMSELEKEFT